jgi:hypothetical protein
MNAIDGVDCESASLCVALDDGGRVLSTTNPAGGAGEWHVAGVDEPNALYAVSCPSALLCVAGDAAGDLVTSSNPTGIGTWNVAHVDGANALYGVSCPSVALCVAVDDAGNVLESVEPLGGAGAWSKTKLEGGGGFLDAVSCPSETLCVATDATDNVRIGTPTGGGGGPAGGGDPGGGGSAGSGGAGGSAGGAAGGGSGGAGDGHSGGGGGTPFARLSVGSPAGGARLMFNGSQTSANGSQIAGYQLRLTSTSETVNCGPQSPVVAVNFAGPTSGTATLTALTASEASATASAPYATPGPTLVRHAKTGAVPYLSKQALVSVQCLPGPSSQPASLTVGGKTVNNVCEVKAGLVDAVGCGLHQVELCSGVQPAERQLLAGHANPLSGCLVRSQSEVRGVFASRARQASTRPAECAFHCVPVVDTYFVSSEPIRVKASTWSPGPVPRS